MFCFCSRPLLFLIQFLIRVQHRAPPAYNWPNAVQKSARKKRISADEHVTASRCLSCTGEICVGHQADLLRGFSDSQWAHPCATLFTRERPAELRITPFHIHKNAVCFHDSRFSSICPSLWPLAVMVVAFAPWPCTSRCQQCESNIDSE